MFMIDNGDYGVFLLHFPQLSRSLFLGQFQTPVVRYSSGEPQDAGSAGGGAGSGMTMSQTGYWCTMTDVET